MYRDSEPVISLLYKFLCQRYCDKELPGLIYGRNTCITSAMFVTAFTSR